MQRCCGLAKLSMLCSSLLLHKSMLLGPRSLVFSRWDVGFPSFDIIHFELAPAWKSLLASLNWNVSPVPYLGLFLFVCLGFFFFVNNGGKEKKQEEREAKVNSSPLVYSLNPWHSEVDLTCPSPDAPFCMLRSPKEMFKHHYQRAIIKYLIVGRWCISLIYKCVFFPLDKRSIFNGWMEK